MCETRRLMKESYECHKNCHKENDGCNSNDHNCGCNLNCKCVCNCR